MAIVPFNLQKNLIVNASGNMMSIDARQPFTIKINTIYGNGNNTFALPLTNHTTNLKIETSDGQSISITNYADTAKLIQFPSAGVYTIKMRGECGWSFNNTGDCQKLTGISNWGRLKFNYLESGFWGCINLGLNDGLPTNGAIYVASTVSSMLNSFRNCNLLTIPVNLLDNCRNVAVFQSIFNTNRLASIPEFLFKYCTGAYNLYAAFANNKITTIPGRLFETCINVNTFQSTFYNNLITAVPNGMFQNCAKVLNFTQTFDTNKITSIGTSIFAIGVLATNYTGTFSFNQLTSIPSDILYNCVNAVNFTQMFFYNLLTSIPSGLLINCVNAEIFTQMFASNRLTSVVSGLFDTCVKAKLFASTFSVNRITSLPESLFYNCKQVTVYGYCFQNALLTGCVMPTVMFDLTVLNIVTDWRSVFSQSTTSYTPTGTVQDIWNYASPTATKTDCFQNCTGLANYASIPVDWI